MESKWLVLIAILIYIFWNTKENFTSFSQVSDLQNQIQFYQLALLLKTNPSITSMPLLPAKLVTYLNSPVWAKNPNLTTYISDLNNFTTGVNTTTGCKFIAPLI